VTLNDKGQTLRVVLKSDLVDRRPPANDPPKASSAPPTPNDGFVPLFSGKDVSGWRQDLNQGNWSVKNGILTGTGGGEVGKNAILVTRRDDYSNFHLRLEMMNPDGKASAISVRCSSPSGKRSGYRIPTGGDAVGKSINPGSISKAVDAAANAVIDWHAAAASVGIKEGEWFTLEVIAQNEAITTMVNGQVAATYQDKGKPILQGEIWLSSRSDTVKHFRKIEIKELP
jgi:hypothetical protein